MSLDGQTQLVGLLGWPVSHSFSPAMHNAAFAALGLNWAYVALPVHPDLVAAAIAGLPALGFRGVNVTVPHKQAVIPLLDELEAGAQAIGAVNMIAVQQENGRSHLTGYNTDWSGFLADLQAHDVALDGRDCLVLGAGGSARAVVYALGQAGGRVTLLARRPEQAATLVQALQPHLPHSLIQIRPLSQLAVIAAQTHAPLIVNTTPLGMTPHPDGTPWPADCPFPPGSFVYDLVYNPRQTRLMQQAAAAGCAAANGLGMLVNQGAVAFALWTGQQPDTAVMRAAIA